jgi:hypothetical protein
MVMPPAEGISISQLPPANLGAIPGTTGQGVTLGSDVCPVPGATVPPIVDAFDGSLGASWTDAPEQGTLVDVFA